MDISAPKDAGPACILLVDDNHNGLAARKTLLEELGYRITTSRSGEEAFQLFLKTPFDVVVTDFRMPKMSGGELIRLIKEKAPATHVILLSGFVEPLGLTEHTTGADVVISKNASEIANLLRSVERLLHRRIPRKPPASQRNSASRVKRKMR